MPELYKYSFFVALFVLIVGLILLVAKWPQGMGKSFSQHAAAQKFTIYYYIGLFTVVLPLLMAFFLGYLIPTLQLPIWFTICIIASMITQYACTFIPEIGGWKTHLHLALAGISALFLLPCVQMLLAAGTVSQADKSIIVFPFLLMISAVALVIIMKGKLRHALIVQALYFAAFFAAILVVVV